MKLARRLVGRLGNALGLAIEKKGEAWRLIEPEQLRRFLREFRVDCVFDVGANEGQYASGLRELGYTGLIVSFEPNPETASIARKAASADPLWLVEEIALDSESRAATFNVTCGSQFSSLLAPNAVAGERFQSKTEVTRTIELQTETLHSIYGKLKAAHGFERPFLKMDTQGHDLAVATGAGPSLSEFVGLQSELALTKLYEGSSSHTEALEFYQARGFELSGLLPNNAGHFPDLLEVDALLYNRAATRG